MKNEYDYKMLTLRGLCLNILYGEDMSYGFIKSYASAYSELQSNFSDEDIRLALQQLVDDQLISKVGEEYHLEEKGKEIRINIMRDYFECSKVILNSFGFKEKDGIFRL